MLCFDEMYVTITGEILQAPVHCGHDVVCLQPSKRKVEALLNLIEEDDETQVPNLSEIDFNTTVIPSSQRKRPSIAVWVRQHPRNTLQGVHPRLVKTGAKT